MGATVRRKAFDGRHGVTGSAEGRDQATMHRLAVDQHRAGAAVAGVATLLDAEMAEFAQERAQALPGTRRFEKLPVVDLERHALRRALQFDADLFREPQRHMLAPYWLAVNVGVVEVVGNALQHRFAQFFPVWNS